MTALDMLADQFLHHTLLSASGVSPADPAIGDVVTDFSIENEAGLVPMFRLTTENGSEVIISPEDEVSVSDQ